MKTWLKVLIIIIILGLIGGYLVYKFVYNKPFPDYVEAKADLTVNADVLYHDFKTNKDTADKKYTGKVLDISGALTRVEEADSLVVAVFVLGQGDFGEEGIRITLLPEFSDKAKTLSKGKELTFKGLCTGFNDSDVIVEKGSIEE